MNTGMQDAFNLGWKLATVVEGERSRRAPGQLSRRAASSRQGGHRLHSGLTKVGTLDSVLARMLRNAMVRLVGNIRWSQR